MRLTKTILLFALLYTGIASASFTNEIKSLYNFSPKKLSQKEIEEKSKQLDKFWSMVQAEKDKYRSLLIKELNSANHTSFFYYDGSKLLLSLGSNGESNRIALKALQKADLNEVQQTDYLLTVTRLSISGSDTSDAAFHILSYPDFKAFIVQHALTLGQDYSLITMLMPIKEELYLTKAIKLIGTGTDEQSVRSLMRLIWYSDTKDALATLKAIASSDKYSKNIRDVALELIASNKTFEKPISNEILAKLYKSLDISQDATYAELKETRRKRFSRVSDEALLELDQITALMKYKKTSK